MGHIDYTSKIEATTPPEWLKVGAAVGRLTNTFAGRYDIVAHVSADDLGPAPAMFSPLSAEVALSAAKAFGPGVTPEMVGDLEERSEQFAWPRATGLIFHEAMHARFSTWDLIEASKELSPSEFRALILLEEGRIESLGLRLFPRNAPFLRAVVLDLIVTDMSEDTTKTSPMRAAAEILALTSARVDAGSVKHSDIENIELAVIDRLGSSLFDSLREIWLEAQNTLASDINKLYALAKEWSRLVEEAAEEAGEPSPGDGAEGDDGEGSGGSSVEDALGSEIMDALRDSAEEAQIGANSDAADQQIAEEREAEAVARNADATRAKDAAKTAADLFSKGTGPAADHRTRSCLQSERAPQPNERAAAVRLAALLEKAKYRERDETEIKSVLPPGRLRTRAVVQSSALKSKGIMSQAEPWRRTVRRHTDDPKLSVGVLVDISGSMAAAMQPMASTAYILSEAVRRVQGRASMVYYGQGVFPVLKPGQHLNEVRVYTAPDATELADDAFKVVDGSLSLTFGTGARLLFIVSDGQYTTEETKATIGWLDRMVRAGVAVTWIDYDHPESSIVNRTFIKNGIGYVNASKFSREDTTGLATEIGKITAATLAKMSAAV